MPKDEWKPKKTEERQNEILREKYIENRASIDRVKARNERHYADRSRAVLEAVKESVQLYPVPGIGINGKLQFPDNEAGNALVHAVVDAVRANSDVSPEKHDVAYPYSALEALQQVKNAMNIGGQRARKDGSGNGLTLSFTAANFLKTCRQLGVEPPSWAEQIQPESPGKTV